MMEVRKFSDDLTELLIKLNSENVHTLADQYGWNDNIFIVDYSVNYFLD